jgi:hypothetical protein
VSACPSCGSGNPENRDFCPKCGSYTHWDPTVQVPAVRPATPDAEQKDEEEAPPLIPTGVPAAVAEGVPRVGVDLALEVPVTPVTYVHSCDISYRPDGLELVFLQSDTCDTVSSIFRVDLATLELHPLQSGVNPCWAPAIPKP